MPICIGGSQHGKTVPYTRPYFEVAIPPPCNIWHDFSDIPVPMGMIQRLAAKVFGIPSSVPRPIQPVQFATEQYLLQDYYVGLTRISAYVLQGIDPQSEETLATVCSLYHLRGVMDARRTSKQADTRPFGEPHGR